MPGHDSQPSVDVGTWVKVVEQGADEPEVFHIVEPPAEDAADNRIALNNPMGQALAGSKAGDEITVHGPVGPIQFDVVSVGREE